MIRVLIVEDSASVCEFLDHIICSDPELKTVGIVHNGEEAVKAVRQFTPDVITMDIFMPKMDGFEATRRIMETQPTPIVIVSGSSRIKEVAFSFRAIEAGALAVVGRPNGINDVEYENSSGKFVKTLKMMSEIKVVRRWPDLCKKITAPPARALEIDGCTDKVQVVAIGASTGGPVALKTILENLPRTFPVPVLIVQHIAPGFAPGFAEWLSESSLFPVEVACDSQYVLPGRAYIAPDGFQMLVAMGNRIRLDKEIAANGLRPSVGSLFRSVAEIFGSRAVGVLLTGMGTDGARELKMMKEKQAVTIAQDEETSVVYGMPGEASRLNAATYILPLGKIGTALTKLTRRNP